MKLFEPINIRNKTAANRIMMAPCVVFGAGTENGDVGEFRMNHYGQRAKDGVGTIVIEAVAVQEKCLGSIPALIGAWSDEHIPQLKKLADRIQKYPVISIVQIMHRGARRTGLKDNEIPFGPSAGILDNATTMREATIEELEGVRDSFITAAVRVQKAGFDGVELHNAHGFFLTQMVSGIINKRTDEYGGTLDKRIKLPLDILNGIREACGTNFIIGVRVGANEPTYDDGIQIAKIYEANGIDYISVSAGYGDMSILPSPPPDFPFNAVVYGGALIKKNIKRVPVILVNDIKTAERGEWLLQNGFGDMIAYGKPLLATPDFVSRARTMPQKNNDCVKCKQCHWFSDYKKCPVFR